MKERIKELCRINGISMNKLEETLRFGKGYISKLGESTPNASKIKKIADYFGVTVDYLMTGQGKRGGETYYLNDETAKLAQEIFKKDKVLFDVYKSSDRDRLIAYANKLKELREMEE